MNTIKLELTSIDEHNIPVEVSQVHLSEADLFWLASNHWNHSLRSSNNLDILPCLNSSPHEDMHSLIVEHKQKILALVPVVGQQVCDHMGGTFQRELQHLAVLQVVQVNSSLCLLDHNSIHHHALHDKHLELVDLCQNTKTNYPTLKK